MLQVKFMKVCPQCGKTVLWGGIKRDGKRYCYADCYRKANPNAADADTIKNSLVDRIINGFGMVYSAVMLFGMVGGFLYSIFTEPTPRHTVPDNPTSVPDNPTSIWEFLYFYIILVVILVIVLFLRVSWRFLMGTSSFEFSQGSIDRLKEFDFAQPVNRLGFRTGFRATGYRYKGRKIAFFDPGPCNLTMPGFKDYHYSCWAVDNVKNTVLEPGSAELAIIYDNHETIVDTEEESDSSFYGFDGTTTFFRSGETEEMAHSETPYKTPAERLIVIGKKVIRARYLKLGKIELTDYRSAQPLGYIRDLLFWGYTRFLQPLPLMDGIFITCLARAGGEETNPYENA